MVDGRQRFCPLCDRVFIAGEAVLRCGNCTVMHHPSCWVKNSGCSQDCDGDNPPEPIAYDVPGSRTPEPHPGEGTRVTGGAMPPPVRGAEPPRDPVERVTTPGTASADAPPGPQAPTRSSTAAPQARPRPNVGAVRPAPPVVIEPPPRAQRGRYESGDRPAPSVEDLNLYGRRGILRYWYVPIAGLVAILVAVGIIWGADQFMGGTSDVPADPGATETTPSPVPGDDDAVEPTETAPAPDQTPAANGQDDGEDPADPTATPGDGPVQTELEPGATAVVTGTDACLNIRSAPGTANTAVACVADGVEVSIVDGPQDEGDFTWWQVETPQGTGWAAGAFLRRVN